MECNNNKLLDPWYITGFVDGEGCFLISVTKDSNSKTGWGVTLGFSIHLHSKDFPLLERIKMYMGVGNILLKTDRCIYQVRSLKDLVSVIDHFDKYPLITRKRADYLLFKQAFELIKLKKHLTSEGFLSLIKIKASINKGLSEELKKSFSDNLLIDKPVVEVPNIIDNNWIAGFIEGEGCFSVKISKSKSNKIGYQVLLRFTLGQHVKDSLLIKNIIKQFNYGIYSEIFTQSPICIITITKLNDLEKLILFLDKYPLQGSKSKDLTDFKQLVKLMKNKAHLTLEGLEKIKLIRSNMNRGRINNEVGG